MTGRNLQSRMRALLVAGMAVALLFSACSGSDSTETALSDSPNRRSIGDPAAGTDDVAPATTGGAPDAPQRSEPKAPDSTSDEGTSDDLVADPEAPEVDTVDTNDDGDDSPAVDAVSEFDAVTSELIAFVEQSRGLKFLERPSVVGLDDAAFTAAFGDLITVDAQRYSTDYTNFTNIYRAMGIIKPTQNLEQIWRDFGDAGVIGFYHPASGDLILRGDEVNPLTRTTLVHELVHALDDQIFDLDRTEYDDRDDEIAWTFSALVEGNAMVIEGRYRGTLSQAERDEETTLQVNLPRTVSLRSFTNSFLDLQLGRYSFGEAFSESLWAQGQQNLDAAFDDPPTTSEQVINPSTYPGTADDAADPPVADAAIFEQGVWGQAAWAAVLGDVMSYDVAQDAAQGWGGDWFVAWKQGEQTCVRSHIQADSPDELDEFAAAIELWVADGDRDVFYPTAELIRVTSCG